MTEYSKPKTLKNSTKSISTGSSAGMSSGTFQTTKDFSHHFDYRYSIYKDLARFTDSFDDEEFTVPDEEVIIQPKKIAFPSIHNGNNQKYVKVENFVHKLNFILFTEEKLNSRYEFKGSVGKGGGGEVKKAIYKPTREVRAIKLIPSNSQDKKKFSNRLEEEGYIMTDIDHPNIVKLFEINKANDECALVLEYLDGGNLLEHYKDENLMTLRNIAHIMTQMLSAIDYLHRNHISHRDIKLENIILEKKDNGPLVKLIDFGIATTFETGKKFSKCAGSPVYMSPEAFLGPYDEKCDLWSLGVVLYILILKELPFRGSSIPELRAKIVTENIDWNTPKVRNADPLAVDLLKKLLEKDPKKRISARKALSERFITKYSPVMSPNSELLRNIKTFGEDGPLKTILHAFEIYQIVPSEDKETLVDLFNSIDKQKMGVITVKDIIDALKQDGADDDDIKKILKNNKYDESKIITFSEFLVSNHSLLKIKNSIHQHLFSVLSLSTKNSDFLQNLQLLLEVNVKNINVSNLIKKIAKEDNSSLFSSEDLIPYL